MKMKLVLFLAVITSFASCISIQFKTPASYRYDKLSPTDQAKVIFNEAQCCSKKNEHLVYAVNAAQVKQCLREHDKSVVYRWAPHCHGVHCLPLSTFVNACLQKGYHPIIVAEYTAIEDIENMNNTDYTVYTMDHRYYQKKKTTKCLKPFQFELTGQKKSKENIGARYLVFSKEKFTHFLVDLNTLK